MFLIFKYNLIHVELNKKYEKPDSEESTYELTVVAIDFEAMKNAKVAICFLFNNFNILV